MRKAPVGAGLVPVRHDPYGALRHPGFNRFLASSLLANLGRQAAAVAIGYHLYKLTGSFVVLTYAALANYLPILLFSLPAGALADHFERKRVLQTGALILAAAAAGLALLSKGNSPLWIWYLLIFAMASAHTLQVPSAVSWYPSLVDRKVLPNAVSWITSNFQVGCIAGPIFGGVLVDLGGAPLALGFASLAPFLSFLLLWGVRNLRKPDARPLAGVPMWDKLTGGLRYIFRQKEISAAITLDMFSVLFGGVEGVMPAFARDVLHVEGFGLGLLKAAPFIGALLAGLVLAHYPLGDKTGKKMLWSVAGFGLTIIAFAFSTWFPLSVFILLLMGAFDLISVVIRQTLVQVRAPEAMRGRIQSVNFLFVGTSNEMGEAESSATAALFGLVPSVILGGCLTLVVVGFYAWRMPHLRNLGRLK